MKTIYEIRLDNLVQLINKAGSAAELSKLIDKPQAQISQWTTRKKRIGDSLSRQIEEKMELPEGWMDISPDYTIISSDKELPFSNDGVNIPQLSTSLTSSTEIEAIAGNLSLTNSWIDKKIGSITDKKLLRYIHAIDDAMEPTFFYEDILLIDIGVKSFEEDGVYVFETQQRLFIKRVEQDVFGNITITSDNPRVKTISTINNIKDIIIIGRVLWAWGGKKI